MRDSSRKTPALTARLNIISAKPPRKQRARLARLVAWRKDPSTPEPPAKRELSWLAPWFAGVAYAQFARRGGSFWKGPALDVFLAGSSPAPSEWRPPDLCTDENAQAFAEAGLAVWFDQSDRLWRVASRRPGRTPETLRPDCCAVCGGLERSHEDLIPYRGSLRLHRQCRRLL